MGESLRAPFRSRSAPLLWHSMISRVLLSVLLGGYCVRGVAATGASLG